MKQLIAKDVHVILEQFFPESTEEERLYDRFQQDSATAHTALMYEYMQPLSDVFGAQLSAVVFEHNVHPILILVIFSSGVV
jgi:hypothetical protein